MNIKEIQHYFEDIAETTGIESGIASQMGTILACTDENLVGQLLGFSEVCEEPCFDGGYGYVRLNGVSDVITFIKSRDKRDIPLLLTIAVSVEKQLDVGSPLGKVAEYYKKVITGEFGTEQIFTGAAEIDLEFVLDRRILVLEVDKHDLPVAMEILAAMYGDSRDITVAGIYQDKLIVVVDQEAKPEDIAFQIVNTLETDCYVTARIGVGTCASNIEEIVRSYETALTTLMVTGAFEAGRKVSSYDKMGISRLVYGISEQTGLNFIKEVLDDEVYESLGDEYMTTINVFFENSLNVSETSRKMFIHRNTLVYRLEKIKKLTGLDITRFEDAAMLKLAMMLRVYLKGDRRKSSD